MSWGRASDRCSHLQVGLNQASGAPPIVPRLKQKARQAGGQSRAAGRVHSTAATQTHTDTHTHEFRKTKVPAHTPTHTHHQRKIKNWHWMENTDQCVVWREKRVCTLEMELPCLFNSSHTCCNVSGSCPSSDKELHFQCADSLFSSFLPCLVQHLSLFFGMCVFFYLHPVHQHLFFLWRMSSIFGSFFSEILYKVEKCCRIGCIVIFLCSSSTCQHHLPVMLIPVCCLITAIRVLLHCTCCQQITKNTNWSYWQVLCMYPKAFSTFTG